MCRNFPKLLTAPADAIAAAKKNPSYGDALGTLIVDGIIVAVAAAVLVTQASGLLGSLFGQTLGISTIVSFVLVFIGGLFVAFLVKMVANTLGGEGDYLRGLTTVAYTMAAPSIGILITAVFFSLAWVGPIIAFLAVCIGLALGVATFYRSIKEMFSTDMITALIAVGVMTMALMLAAMLLLSMFGINAMMLQPGLTGLGA